MIYFIIDQILDQITIMKFILFISFISLLEVQEIFGTQDYTTDQYEGTTDLPKTTPYEEEPTTYSSVRNKRAGRNKRAPWKIL